MDTQAELAATWRRIEAWLGAHAPPLAALLGPPAAPPQIAAAEAALGRTLPADFTASVQLHDGQLEAGFEVFGTWALMSLESLVAYWQMLEELAASGTFEDTGPIEAHGAVRATWWHPGWIPFAKTGTGDLLCLDLDPPEGGAYGQVISYMHDGPRRKVVKASFAAWLAYIADELEADRYEVVGDGNRLRRRR